MNLALPRIEPLDLRSGAGAEALAEARGAFGDPLAALAQQCERLFIIASPEAPRLSIVGAQADPVQFGALAGAGRLSATGSGSTLAAALSSCLGELAERLSLCEQPGDVVARAPLQTLRDRIFPPALGWIEARARDRGLLTIALDFVEVTETDGAIWLAPADDALLRPVWNGLRDETAAITLGAAAGCTFAQAARAAAYELIERDACALWWVGGAPARALPEEAAVVAQLVERRLRKGASGRRTTFLDISVHGAPPCVVAVSSGGGLGFAIGAAADADFESAIERSAREMAQNEVGLLFARARRDAGVDAPASDLGHLARDVWNGDERLAPEPPVANIAHEADDPLKYLNRQTHRIAVAELTRSTIGTCVVKFHAPDLESTPGARAGERLRQTLGRYAGWTGKLPMF